MPGGRPKLDELREVEIATAVAQEWRERFQQAVTHRWERRRDPDAPSFSRRPPLWYLMPTHTARSVPRLNGCYESVAARKGLSKSRVRFLYMKVQRHAPELLWSEDEPRPARGRPYYKLPASMLDPHQRRIAIARDAPRRSYPARGPDD